MAEETTKLPETQSALPMVEYHNTPSTCFRTIHADGALGGITPTGRQVYFILYSERTAIPATSRHPIEVADKGLVVGKEIPGGPPLMGRIERTLEADIRMDIEAAVNLYHWLRAQFAVIGVDPGAASE
jgi:hypothetical protein